MVLLATPSPTATGHRTQVELKKNTETITISTDGRSQYHNIRLNLFSLVWCWIIAHPSGQNIDEEWNVLINVSLFYFTTFLLANGNQPHRSRSSIWCAFTFDVWMLSIHRNQFPILTAGKNRAAHFSNIQIRQHRFCPQRNAFSNSFMQSKRRKSRIWKHGNHSYYMLI